MLVKFTNEYLTQFPFTVVKNENLLTYLLFEKCVQGQITKFPMLYE
jgi:hypothetical protein